MRRRGSWNSVGSEWLSKLAGTERVGKTVVSGEKKLQESAEYPEQFAGVVLGRSPTQARLSAIRLNQ